MCGRIPLRPVNLAIGRLAVFTLTDEQVLLIFGPDRQQTSIAQGAADERGMVQMTVVGQCRWRVPHARGVVPSRRHDFYFRTHRVQIFGGETRVLDTFPQRHGVTIAVVGHLWSKFALGIRLDRHRC